MILKNGFCLVFGLRFKQGLAVENGEPVRGVSASALFDCGSVVPAAYGSIPVPRIAAIDFRQVALFIQR